MKGGWFAKTSRAPPPRPSQDGSTCRRSSRSTAARSSGGPPGWAARSSIATTWCRTCSWWCRRLPELRADAALTSWLYKIAENVATRRRQRERLRRWIRGMSRDCPEDVAAPGPSAIDEMERREAALEIYAALDRLDEKYRSVVILFEIEGFTGEEIAALTGRPLATVWFLLLCGCLLFRCLFVFLLVLWLFCC